MLCARRKLTGEIVEAYFANKSQAPFSCPECGDPVVLKNGRTKINYFAHDKLITCQFAQSESDAHRQCKIEIYEALKREPNVSDVVLERPLGTIRPDVSAYIDGVKVAIEVQISSLSVDTIMRRTIDYHRKGIYVLWLLQWTPKLDADRYTPKMWEKWIHATYFGRVYYWTNDLTVVSYHFDPKHKRIPKQTWYSESGKKMTAGGYSRRLKLHRKAIRGRTLHLTRDFAPRLREWWEGNGVKVPDAKLFTQRQ